MIDYEAKRAELERAAKQLARSDRGRHTMRDLESFLRGPARALDNDNRRAVMLLLGAFYGELPGTVIELLEEHGTPRPDETADEG